MPDFTATDRGPTVAEAFAALPLETPDRSAWPALAARIDSAAAPAHRGLRQRRWLFALAAAAALAVVALMPRALQGPDGAPSSPALATTPASATPAPATTADPLDALMAESARLEYLVQAVSADAMASGSTAALAVEYESRVQQIDAALSDPSLAAADRTALWSRRVDLLREYAGLQGTAQWLAAQGGEFEGDLVAVF